MENGASGVPVPLPRPTYRVPHHWFVLRRIRRRQIPVPRSPFMHFLSDCISQQISTLENRPSYQGAIWTITQIWLRMSNKQKIPWLQMTEKDMTVIAQLVPYYAECLRRGRQITLGPADKTPARERSQAMPITDYGRIFHDPFGVPVDPKKPLPPIVLLHGRQPVVIVQPIIIFNHTRRRLCTDFSANPTGDAGQQDNPSTISEVEKVSETELPFLEAQRARYATPMRSTYHSPQSQDSQHEESFGSRDTSTTLETRDDSSDSSGEQVELTFLEAHRNRYATPERSTYHASVTTQSTTD